MASPAVQRAFDFLFRKAISHLFSAQARYQQEILGHYLENTARIHNSVVLGESAGLSNGRGDPHDIVVGQNSAILGEIITFPQGGRVVIGERCFVGANSRLWSAASITVGNYVLISHDVNIHDNASHSQSWEERRVEVDAVLPHMRPSDHHFNLRARPIVIEDDVWVGFGSTILAGVKVGRGAIIGAGTMVTTDVPAFAVVVGNPMRIVRSLGAEVVVDAV